MHMGRLFPSAALATFFLLASSAVAAEISYTLKTDGAYYFESGIKTGKDHISPTTGLFDGIELRTAFEASSTLPGPLGTHPLFREAEFQWATGLEVSPVTVRALLDCRFTPLPFLILKAGASLGTGWNAFGLDGLGVYDKDLADYEGLTSFSNDYYDLWAGGTLQFDTGILFPGEWTHVVMQLNGTVQREAVTGVDNGEIWIWMESENHANGALFEASAFLGYQMPLPVNLVGILFEVSGHFDGSDYGDYDATFDGDFRDMDCSLMANIAWNASNSITFLARLDSRRSYDTPHSDKSEEPLLQKTGREWYFDGILFRWEHHF